MLHIEGIIGYSILKNHNTNTKIILFSDMHDDLPTCKYKSISVSKILEKNLNKALILLEEVIRGSFVYKSLWNSKHTTELKNLYCNYKNIIIPIDIRPYLIPFSWEVVHDSEYKYMVLNEYLKDLLFFFYLKNETIFSSSDKKKIQNNKILITHLVSIIKKFHNFYKEYVKYKNESILNIYKNNQYILENINNILNDCMEWYICAQCILTTKYKKILIHAGLYHTDKIKKLLESYYNFTIIKNVGMTNIDDNINYTCKPFSNLID